MWASSRAETSRHRQCHAPTRLVAHAHPTPRRAAVEGANLLCLGVVLFEEMRSVLSAVRGMADKTGWTNPRRLDAMTARSYGVWKSRFPNVSGR